MAIQYEPSFWDVLGEGLVKGTEGFFNARDRRRRMQQEDEQNQLQKFSIMNQLFQQGAVNNDVVNSAGRNAGLTLDVQPNQHQQRRELMKRPDLNIPVPGGLPGTSVRVKGSLTATDDEREGAGMQPISAIEGAQLDVAGKRHDLKSGGIKLESDQRKDSEDRYSGDASRSVDQAIGKLGGQITKTNLQRVAQSAFQDYVAQRSAAGSPLTASETAMLQPYFAQAAMNRYKEMEAMRIKEVDATTFSPNGSANQAYVRLAAQIPSRMNIINTQIKAKKDGLPYMLATARLQAGKGTPEDQQLMAEIQGLESQMETLNQAHAKLMMQDVAGAVALISGQATVTPEPAPVPGAPGNVATPTPQHNPRPGANGKRVINKDQKAYLESLGKFDPKLYEVR
jgi:hypothetical protein